MGSIYKRSLRTRKEIFKGSFRVLLLKVLKRDP